jgi:hypothetical protein
MIPRGPSSMSALPPKADMCGAMSNIRYGPIADSCTATCAIPVSIDQVAVVAAFRFLRARTLRHTLLAQNKLIQLNNDIAHCAKLQKESDVYD